MCKVELTKQRRLIDKVDSKEQNISGVVPPTGVEPVAFPLGGGRSIQLSYGGVDLKL